MSQALDSIQTHTHAEDKHVAVVGNGQLLICLPSTGVFIS